MPLKLRRPRDFRAAPGYPDDFDVIEAERRIGRIFRSASAPQDRPWMLDHYRSSGRTASAIARIRRDVGRGDSGVC
jgi:hypothetical protein